jgi:hypothetical protein
MEGYLDRVHIVFPLLVEATNLIVLFPSSAILRTCTFHFVAIAVFVIIKENVNKSLKDNSDGQNKGDLHDQLQKRVYRALYGMCGGR